MINLKLFTFVKRHNSTAWPDTTSAGATSVDVVLKAPTSINNPTFILELNSYPTYNYIVWEDMHMYYFVDDVIIRTNNIFELVCSIDPLATARQYILGTEAFVKYSTVAYNEYLKDDRIIPTAEIETEVFNNQFSDINYFNGYTSEYAYLLTTFSETQGISTYLMNWTEVKYLVSKLIQDGDSVIGGVKQIFSDAKGSIVDLKICPITRDALQQQSIIGSLQVPIYLGSYDTTQQGYLLDSYKYETSDLLSFTLPEDFTLCEPYTSAKIHLPLIGVCDISLDELQDVSNIKFKFICNLATGNVSYILWKGNGNLLNADVKVIGTYSGNCSMSIPLGFNQSSNPTGAVMGAASLVGGLLTGGAMTIAGIAGAVASFSSRFTKSTSIIGAFNGNFGQNGNNRLSITLYKHGLSEQPENMATLYGRPLAQVKRMSELLGGYVQTSQFELLGDFDAEITRQVNEYMDSGVYLQ